MTAPWIPTRWWRVTYADGRCYKKGHRYEGQLQIWCETSNEAEARKAVETCPDGGMLHRLYERAETEWREVPS